MGRNGYWLSSVLCSLSSSLPPPVSGRRPRFAAHAENMREVRGEALHSGGKRHYFADRNPDGPVRSEELRARARAGEFGLCSTRRTPHVVESEGRLRVSNPGLGVALSLHSAR